MMPLLMVFAPVVFNEAKKYGKQKSKNRD